MSDGTNGRAGSKQFGVVLSLGITQTLAWASSTYLPAILAAPIASDLAISRSTVFGAYSVSLLVMAAAGPVVGRAIDRYGGRNVLIASNITLAAGLGVLGFADQVATLFVAWCILGAGMAMGLYDAAFAALVRIYGTDARKPITGITLIGGFASTVGWPLSAYMNAEIGWRGACFVWAGLHMLMALPMNWRFIPRVAKRMAPLEAHSTQKIDAGEKSQPVAPALTEGQRRTSFTWLAIYFATTAFVASAYGAHLPGLLGSMGAGAAGAIMAAALLGPAQVVARLAEYGVLSRFRLHAITTARVATAAHPLAAAILLTFGGAPICAAVFAILHGAGNGIITIAKGTLPLALFGPTGYGLMQGRLGVGARVMQAGAPFLFGVVLERWGGAASLFLSGALALVSLVSLFMIKGATEKESDEKRK